MFCFECFCARLFRKKILEEFGILCNTDLKLNISRFFKICVHQAL